MLENTAGNVLLVMTKECFVEEASPTLVESTSATQSHDQAPPPAPPTAEQLASIESDTFAPEKFVSHRTSGRSKQV